MFKLQNSAQRQKNIERIKEVETQIEKIRTTRRPEEAEAFAKVMRQHIAELKEQIRIYGEEKKGNG